MFQQHKKTLTRENLKKILESVLLIGLIVPLIAPFITIHEFYFPFIYSKTLFFQVIVELLLVIYIPLVIAYPEFRPSFKSKMNLSFLAVLGVFLITSLISPNVRQSFWSTQERGSGFFNFLHFGAYYFMLITVFQHRSWIWLLRFAVGSGLFMMLYSLNEYFIIRPGERTQTTFGNPGFLGTYFMFLIFFILLLAYKEKAKFVRYALLASEFLVFFAIVINQTRAVFLGIFAAVVLALIIIPAQSKRFGGKKTYIAVGIVIVGMFFFGLLTITGNLPAQMYEKVPLLGRLHNISIHNNVRLLSWKSGFMGLQERPLVGFGLENFSIPFNKYYDPKLIELTHFGGTLNFDKAHNQWLEMLINIGIVGFIVYIGFFVVMSVNLWKHTETQEGSIISRLWKHKRMQLENIILFLFLVAYSVANSFSFDTPSSYILTMIMFALIYTHTHIPPKHHQKENAPIPSNPLIMTAVFSGFAVLLSLGFLHIKPALASHYAALGSSSYSSGQPTEVVYKYYQKAIEYHSVYSFDFARMYGMDVFNTIDFYNPAQKNIIVEVMDALRPGSINDWHKISMLARGYHLLCAEEPKLCETALEYLDYAEKLAPYRYQIHTERYATYMKMFQIDKAVESMERAQALGYQANELEYYSRLGFLYAKTETYDKAFEYYLKAHELEPTNIAVLESLALTAKLQGNYETARTYAQKMLSVDPTTQRLVEQFLLQVDELEKNGPT